MNGQKHKTWWLSALLSVGIGCGYQKPQTVMPTILQLNPSSAGAGSGQFQLEVDGSNFASGAVVNFNGTAENTRVMNSTTLEALIPASAIMTAATVPVTVTNPASGAMYGNMGPVTSSPMNFSIH
jgi:hypothetical protein